MPNTRPAYTAKVGELIAGRRRQLGLTQLELASRIDAPVSGRTVTNAETGRTAVTARHRGAWERALGWPEGALTHAYRTGELPRVGEPVDPEAHALLEAAGVPARYHEHPDVSEILTSKRLRREDKIGLLQVWVAQHHAFVQAYEMAASRMAGR